MVNPPTQHDLLAQAKLLGRMTAENVKANPQPAPTSQPVVPSPQNGRTPGSPGAP